MAKLTFLGGIHPYDGKDEVKEEETITKSKSKNYYIFSTYMSSTTAIFFIDFSNLFFEQASG